MAGRLAPRYDLELSFMSSIDLKFKIFAYMWTKIYVAPVYTISFAVPYLKRTIKNYENLGDRKSILLISSISGAIFSAGFYFIGEQLEVEELSIFYLVFIYLATFLWGAYWLFLQSDYQRKSNSNS